MASTSLRDSLISTLNRYRDEAQADASSRHEIWDNCWDAYDGDIFKNVVFQDTFAQQEAVAINLLKSTINTTLPIICDALPTWYVRAYNPADDVKADLLTSFLQGLWYDQRLDRSYPLAGKDALVCGTGALKVFLNTTRQRGALPSTPVGVPGRVDCAYLDPYSLYPDPNAHNLEDCAYLSIRCVMPEDMVRRIYPDADLDAMESELQSERRGQWYKDTRDTGEQKRFEVWETYYDFGRNVAVWSGNEILSQGPSPIPEGRYPVVLLLDDERGTDMWGSGMIANGGDELQLSINKLVWRINQHARFCIYPQYVKTGIGTVVASNEPGHIFNLNSLTADLKPLQRPEMPPYVFSLAQLLLGMWDNMTGIHDVTQGQRPQGVQSGAAIMRLQEAAQTRIRQMIRLWSLQLGDVGQLVLDTMQKHYTGLQTTFNMGTEGPNRVAFQAEEVLRDPFGGPVPYRVIVQPQSDLPMGQAAMTELMMQISAVLPTLPMPLQKMILARSRIPGWQEYVQAMQQQALDMAKQARMQELEAATQGRQDLESAGSPEPMGPDTRNPDFVAMLAAMQQGAGGNGEAPPSEG